MRLPKAHDNEQGFTLVELLTCLVVLGVLASLAVPAFNAQRRKAYEASAKSDVKALVKEAISYYVDNSGRLAIAGSDGTWTMRGPAGFSVSGSLSPHNTVSATSYANSDSDYCFSVLNSKADAQFWTADGVGLRPGGC